MNHITWLVVIGVSSPRRLKEHLCMNKGSTVSWHKINGVELLVHGITIGKPDTSPLECKEPPRRDGIYVVAIEKPNVSVQLCRRKPCGQI